MAITFHCEHCGKKIEAADTAGGKWGKCPSCHNKLYVPSMDTGEELKLAPIDETFVEREHRLMAETQRLTQDILKEKDIPDGPAPLTGALYQMGDKELAQNVITYLRQMVSEELDEAESTAALIAPFSHRAVVIIDRIALSEIPEPELADIPPQVLAGSIRTLREKIGGSE
jgi:phage FluMu protein Com